MSNPYNNEVIFNGQTLMSLKEDTITPNKVLAGETFHDRSGAPQTGSLITHNVYDGLDSTSTSDALSANMGKALNESIYLLSNNFKYETRELIKTVESGVTYSVVLNNVPTDYIPIALVNISVTFSYECCLLGFRKISNEWRIGVYSKQGDNRLVGTIGVLFIKQ